ncbi:hypothetical protein R4P70_29755 [Rhodococcus sp. IEGM 1241]|uniref:hypothetical protein n=1 Tax=Rhodococcus sp. IEGM 1241 TaxID=3082228 RepID=UPI00295546AC|nr:hypothetical protein [Rhodococcus sp. IEGM 1241]MDV8015511.1 hypothetical protein [Rhodococcus sp. IEGM 1241]
MIRGEAEELAGRLWVVPGILNRSLEALGEFPPGIRHGWGCRGRPRIARVDHHVGLGEKKPGPLCPADKGPALHRVHRGRGRFGGAFSPLRGQRLIRMPRKLAGADRMPDPLPHLADQPLFGDAAVGHGGPEVVNHRPQQSEPDSSVDAAPWQIDMPGGQRLPCPPVHELDRGGCRPRFDRG